MNSPSDLVSLVENGFGHPQVLVVGDLMLDKYVWGEVERISPEAPVPVLRTGRRSEQPGGAANVAMNLAGLGARVTVMGFGGGDDDQHELEALLRDAGVQCSIVACPGSPTTSKLRVLAGHQQLLRMDYEARPACPAAAAESLLEGVAAALPETSIVVLSDYAKGVLSDQVCRTIIAEARSAHVPVVVDPKGQRLYPLPRRHRDLPEREGIGSGHGRVSQRSEPAALGRTGYDGCSWAGVHAGDA